MPNTLAEALNRSCRCTTVDHGALARALAEELEDGTFYQWLRETRPHLFSDTAVFAAPRWAHQMRELVRAVETLVALPGYQDRVLAGAPAIARLDPGPRGVFFGYDFHLTAAGPRLIEINTNAGGALLNGVLARAQLSCCQTWAELTGTVELATLETEFVAMFRDEWRRQRGDIPLRRVAIVDDAPTEQYLYPEFILFQRLFTRHGIEAVIAAADELEWRDGGLYHAGLGLDLVYNRLTDFYFDEPAHTALRAAYAAGTVVVTPHPRAHALYADKRNLVLLSDAAALRAWSADEETLAAVRDGIAPTVRVEPAEAERLWAERRRWFFKPAAGYGSKAVYRGDKLTRRVWQEILAGDYVAQEYASPGQRTLKRDGTDAALKFDVRAYAYAGRVQLFAARLYQGQTTNFRTPGGGFAPVYFPGPGVSPEACAASGSRNAEGCSLP